MSGRELDRSEWRQEGPGPDVRTVAIATRVLAGSLVFFFGGFFFAFVYLRLQNVNDHWNHIDAEASTALGIVVLAAALIAAVLLLSLRGRHRVHELGSWRARGFVVLLLILMAIVGRVIQLWSLDVAPDASGFVAVLIGWSAMLVAVEIGALYWIITLVARAGRLSRTAVDPERGADDPELFEAEARFQASASSFTLLWWVLAGVELLAFVLLDVIR